MSARRFRSTYKDNMNTTDVEIKIPAAINALPLTLTEKAVLAHIRNFPGCSNSRLAELIGGSRRGVEKLLRRLRDQGYIEPSRSEEHTSELQSPCNLVCR